MDLKEYKLSNRLYEVAKLADGAERHKAEFNRISKARDELERELVAEVRDIGKPVVAGDKVWRATNGRLIGEEYVSAYELDEARAKAEAEAAAQATVELASCLNGCDQPATVAVPTLKGESEQVCAACAEAVAETEAVGT